MVKWLLRFISVMLLTIINVLPLKANSLWVELKSCFNRILSGTRSISSTIELKLPKINLLNSKSISLQNSSKNSETSETYLKIEDIDKINSWKYPPSRSLYSKNKKVFDDPKYYNQKTGDINWPDNNGFQGNVVDEILQPGTRIDRYGSDFGKFTAPVGIPYSMRALPPGTDLKPYSVFEVTKPLNVKSGMIAKWFDSAGGG